MINKKNLEYIILFLIIVHISVCICIVSVYLTNFFHLSFLKKELSFGEILNSITAISLAFLIPFIVEKRFNRSKTVFEMLNARLCNLQKDLEGLVFTIQENCSESDLLHIEENKQLINLKLRKIAINIYGFTKDSPKEYKLLISSFAKFRKLTTALVSNDFTFDKKFYQDVYIRYIDFDRCIEDMKIGIIDVMA